MCVLFLELALLANGLYSLFTGKVYLTEKIKFQGWQARLVGLILVFPIPASLMTGIILGRLVGKGTLTEETVWELTGTLEWGIVICCVLAVIGLSSIIRPKA